MAVPVSVVLLYHVRRVYWGGMFAMPGAAMLNSQQVRWHNVGGYLFLREKVSPEDEGSRRH
jgi:hypothetical protein